jgi:hypothetical protein
MSELKEPAADAAPGGFGPLALRVAGGDRESEAEVVRPAASLPRDDRRGER